MALFFAYGTELDQAKVLSRTLANASQNTSIAEVTAEGSPPKAQAPDAALDADTSQAQESENKADSRDSSQTTPPSPIYSYPFQTPLAHGYAIDKALVYRRPEGDSGDLVTALESRVGAYTWGVLFELSDDTLEAMCREFDARRSCTKQIIAIDRLLPGWNASGSALTVIRDMTVEASCLIAVDSVHRLEDIDDITTGILLRCYGKYDAPVSAYAGLFSAKSSSIDGLRTGERDLAERNVLEIYYKAPPRFAIYRTDARVAVQYADQCALADTQRSNMAALNSTRSQIAGLIDGWEKSRYQSFADRAARYNARVAAALNQCLEGDGLSAKSTLEDIKADVLAERASWGRFQYLLGALLVAVLYCAIFWLIKDFFYPPPSSTHNLWLAARAGTVGAFFSIAMNIQNRKILTDLHARDNLADSALRITIGCIGAGVLLCLLQSGLLPTANFGATPLTGKSLGWDVVVVMGFIAGFTERLVPNIVDKMAPQAAPAPSSNS
jgi:hypothetical protein